MAHIPALHKNFPVLVLGSCLHSGPNSQADTTHVLGAQTTERLGADSVLANSHNDLGGRIY